MVIVENFQQFCQTSADRYCLTLSRKQPANRKITDEIAHELTEVLDPWPLRLSDAPSSSLILARREVVLAFPLD
jgi:hypothetical protein